MAQDRALPRVSRPEFVVFKPFKVFASGTRAPFLIIASWILDPDRGRLEDRHPDTIRPITDPPLNAFLDASTATWPAARSSNEISSSTRRIAFVLTWGHASLIDSSPRSRRTVVKMSPPVVKHRFNCVRFAVAMICCSRVLVAVL